VVGPGVATVGRGRHDQRLRGSRHPPEGAVADVGVPEERAGFGVIRPHLLLVGEQRGALLADDDRCLPVGLGGHGRRREPGRGRAVDPRHRDRLEPPESLLAGEVRGQVRVVQPRPVRPRELAVAVHGTERHCRVPVGDQARIEVAGERADRPDPRLAGRVVAGRAHAVAGAPARIGGLDPRGAAVEREVHARRTDAFGERAVVVGTRVAGLHVDVVVGAGRQHGGVVGVDRHRRLVLLVGRERRRWAAHGHQRVGVERDGGPRLRGNQGRHRDNEHRPQGLPHGSSSCPATSNPPVPGKSVQQRRRVTGAPGAGPSGTPADAWRRQRRAPNRAYASAPTTPSDTAAAVAEVVSVGWIIQVSSSL
jgi:hypothetical protein